MLVTRGLGRKSAQNALLVTWGLGRNLAELGGKFVRRWKSRLVKRDLEDLPITTRREFLKRVQAALQGLKGDASPALRKRAERVEKGLLEADSVRRKSLRRLDFTVVLAQLDLVQWAFDAYEEQRHRRREEDEFVVLMLAARSRGWI